MQPSSPSATPVIDAAAWQAWLGRSETVTDTLHPGPLAGLSATIDTAPFQPLPGQAVPPLWHWAYFLSQAPAHSLGRDGHPRRGDFLPPVALPRRMWAGSRFVFEQPLRVGDVVQRRLRTVGSGFLRRGQWQGIGRWLQQNQPATSSLGLVGSIVCLGEDGLCRAQTPALTRFATRAGHGLLHIGMRTAVWGRRWV